MIRTRSKSKMQEKLSNKNLYYASLLLFALVIISASALLVVEPNGFNAKAAIAPLVAILFISGLGVGKFLSVTPSSKLLSKLGTISLAILLTFIGFFIVAAVAWFVALSYT